MRAVPDAKNAAQFCHDFVNGSHFRDWPALPFVIAVDVGAAGQRNQQRMKLLLRPPQR